MNVNVKNTTENTGAVKMYGGLEQFEIVGVSPTIQEINKIYGKENGEDDKDIEYVDQKEGFDRIRITFFLKALQTNRIRRTSFYIVDKPRTDKDGNKHQYVNQVGQTTWSDSEDNLTGFFVNFERPKTKEVYGKKSYRIAREGEGDFYEFARSVMSHIKYSDSTTDIMFDFKKLVRGDFSELNRYFLDKDITGVFTALNYVKVEDGGEGRIFNEVSTRNVLAGDMYPKVCALMSNYYKETLDQIKEDKEYFERLKIQGIRETLTVDDIYGYVVPPEIRFKDEWDNRAWARFKKETEEEYGVKGFYKIAPVFEYHPSMEGAGEPIKVLSHDTSY